MKLHLCSQCNHRHGRSISVDGLLIEKGKILLVKRGKKPYQGYWALPGGYVEFGEEVEEACIREFKEETGVNVRIKEFLGLYSSPSRHPAQNIAAAFLVERIGGKEMPGDDAVHLAWHSLNRLPEKLAFDHLTMINDCRKLLPLGGKDSFPLRLSI